MRQVETNLNEVAKLAGGSRIAPSLTWQVKTKQRMIAQSVGQVWEDGMTGMTKDIAKQGLGPATVFGGGFLGFFLLLLNLN